MWELIRKGIVVKVKAGGKLKEAVFNFAFNLKKSVGRKSYIAWLLDTLIFKAVKEATGGRLMYGVNGGAPLSRDTQEFLSTALVMVIQGYGEPLSLYDTRDTELSPPSSSKSQE